MKIKDLVIACKEDLTTKRCTYYGFPSVEIAIENIKTGREQTEAQYGVYKPKYIFYLVDSEDEIFEDIT